MQDQIAVPLSTANAAVLKRVVLPTTFKQLPNVHYNPRFVRAGNACVICIEIRKKGEREHTVRKKCRTSKYLRVSKYWCFWSRAVGPQCQLTDCAQCSHPPATAAATQARTSTNIEVDRNLLMRACDYGHLRCSWISVVQP